jgi:stage III sporulation protein SpoIIIAA
MDTINGWIQIVESHKVSFSNKQKLDQKAKKGIRKLIPFFIRVYRLVKMTF